MTTLGKQLSEETKRKMSLAKIGNKNSIGVHKKWKWSEESKKKASERLKGKYPDSLLFGIGENHQAWKGDNVGYDALHNWVHKHLPKPDSCPSCNQVKRLDASNISGKYLRDITDWQWLCHSCHGEFDSDMRFLVHK